MDWFNTHLGVELLFGLLLLVVVVTWLVVRFGQHHEDTSTAWDSGFRIPKVLSKAKEGIYLGVAEDGPKVKLYYDSDRHIMTVGPNGSGKSMRSVYENLHNGLKDWSAIVVDPKGDLARLTYAARNGAYIIDPFGVVPELRSVGFNPLALLNPDSKTFVDDAMNMAEAMIRIEGSEPHWAASAQDLVCALIMAESINEKIAAEAKDWPPETPKPKANLASVRDVIGLPTEDKETHNDFKTVAKKILEMAYEHKYPALAAKMGRYTNIDSTNRELNSILSTALTQTRWLDSPLIREDLTKPIDVKFMGMIARGWLKIMPVTIYIVLPPDRIGTHNLWIRLVVASILRPLMKDTKEPENRTVLILDEFPALAEGDGFPAISRNMAMMRGYGLTLWSVWQDLSQATRIYGQHWETFASNAGILQAFQPQDLKTSTYLSERTGLTTRETASWSFSGRQPQISGGQQGMPQMLPQAVRAMQEGHTLVFSGLEDDRPVRSYLRWPPSLETPVVPAAVPKSDPTEGAT